MPSLQSSKFIHARSELAVGVYKLKPRALMLHHEFLQRLRRLPTDYSYGEYRELLRDFGTHFIKEATVGGIYEYTLVMNSEELRKAGMSEGGEGVLGMDFGVGKPLCRHIGMAQLWGQGMGEGINSISNKSCRKCGSRDAHWQ